MGEVVEVCVESVSVTEGGIRAMREGESACRSMHTQDQDAWLPITESRKGSSWTSTLLLLSSGIGIQALTLPAAFVPLGWLWGILCLSLAFVWQLYTIWLLVNLHESVPGTRYSRYLHLSVAAFGKSLGKLVAIFPVMFLSGGTCVLLIITGGGTMELFYKAMCGDELACLGKGLSSAEWYLVFTCLAIFVAQFCPNLNSVGHLSLIGAITAVGYCTMIWILSVCKGRPDGAFYDPSKTSSSESGRTRDILSAIGTIVLAFRGHNVVLEIQGTLPSSPEHPSHKPMWRAVTMSYLLIALCFFPLAIIGYWSYGNMIAATGGILTAFSMFHGNKTSKFIMGVIYLLVVVNCLTTFPIYAMPVFDTIESGYTSKRNKRCPKWVRSGFRVLFGALIFFVSVAVPFLGSLGLVTGGIALPLTFSYPCFMWNAIKKLRPNCDFWSVNLVLGCLGIALSVLLVVAGVWKLVNEGLDANFFHPR